MKTETLICESGNHKWVRTSARGRKPRVCPDHAGKALPTAPSVETVTVSVATEGERDTLELQARGMERAIALTEMMRPLHERDAKRRASR